MRAKKTSGRRQSTKRSARTSPKRASKSEPKFTELGFRVERLPNGDVQVTLSEWLAKSCLPLAINNHATTYSAEGLSFIAAALKNMARDLKCEGVTIDG
jgi:hypothetical protein